MIPISLTIQGVYSYKQKQTINFENLSKAGIFGIFGKTGSGKSAIIDAILFCLYGETERLNNRENRYYNMMNLHSNEMYIDFVCSQEFSHTKYRFIVTAKRSKKHFEKITYSRTCYKQNNDDWQPADSSITEKEITGLSYEHYKRTGIIPQGHFMEFLHLSASERIVMMKDIFNLHDFDLYDNTKALLNETEDQENHLLGQLEGIGLVSEEELELQKQKLESLEAEITILQKTIQSAKQEIDTLSKRAEDVSELTQLQKVYADLLQEAPVFTELEQKIQQIEQVVSNAKPLWDMRAQKYTELEKLRISCAQTEKEISKKQAACNLLSEQCKSAQKTYEELPSFVKKTEALQELQEIRNLRTELSALEERKEKGSAIVLSTQKELETIEATREQLNITRETVKQELDDISYLTEQKAAIENYTKICAQIEELRKERIAATEIIEKKSQQLFDVYASFGITEQSLSFDFADFALRRKKELETQKHALEKNLQLAHIQKEISFLQKNLQAGTACPVCGSTEHSPLVAHTPTEDTHRFEKQISEIDSAIDSVQEAKTKVAVLLQEIRTEQKRDKDASHKMHAFTIERNLNEPDEKPEKILERITRYHTQTKQISEIEKQITDSTAQKKTTADALETYKLAIVEINDKITSVRTSLEHHNKRCAKEIQEEYKDVSSADIQNIITQRIREAEESSVAYSRIQKEYETRSHELTKITAVYATLSSQKQEIEKELELIHVKISDYISSSSFESEEQIALLLQESSELVAYTKKLEQYKHACASNQQRIAILEKKLQDVEFNPEVFAQKKVEFAGLEQLFIEKNEARGKEKNMYAEYSEKLQKQATIKKELSQVQIRIENLKVLRSMFSSKGFVSFMSTRYLQILCDIANERFGILTKQTLSLEVSDDNSFVIRDYLHNGKIRHIKTLSGGQAFQAALCLALALSHTIQIESPITSHFFFIDEGFGSQDKDSLHIVFETLRSLQKEGKTVGIISHVEELKELIPLYISVTQTAQHGSLISVN